MSQNETAKLLSEKMLSGAEGVLGCTARGSPATPSCSTSTWAGTTGRCL